MDCPTDTAPRPASRLGNHLVAVLLPGALALSALCLGSFHGNDLTLRTISRSVSRSVGVPVKISGIRGSLAPSIIIEGITVGGQQPDLTIQLLEVNLGLHIDRRPSIDSVRVFRPRLRLSVDQARTLARAGVRRAAGPRPRIRSGARKNVPALIIEDGTLDLRFSREGAEYRLRARGVNLRPRGDALRVVTGKTTLHAGEERLIVLDAISADVDPRRRYRVSRLAAMGGVLSHPRAPTAALAILTLELEERLDGYLLKLKGKPVGRSTGRISARMRLNRSWRPAGPDILQLALQNTDLSSAEPLLGPLGVQVGDARASGEITLTRLAGEYRLQILLATSRFRIDHPVIAHRTVGPVAGQLGGLLSFSPASGQLKVHRLGLVSGDVRLELKGTIDHSPTRTRISMDLDLPETPCQKVLASLPRGFAPKLQGMALGGTLGVAARLRLDTNTLDRAEVSMKLSPQGCRVLADPPDADVRSLARELTVLVSGPRGTGLEWIIGPSNPSFRPFHRISRHLKSAFIVAEDHRFFRHRGFDEKQLKRAFVSNMQQRRIARGASTISQQVIKNVFLSHKRTIARKFQEAVLTWRMEQVVPKKRILELYLNLVEMGPGIYGVAQATEHYFGKSPTRVTPLQAAHLAALTPAPRYLGHRFRAGEAGPAWTRKLHMLLRMMRRRGTISREEQRRWSSEPLSLLKR